MKDELTKIAEIAFKQFVAKYTWFADVGTELRNIQQELGDIAGRTKSIEKILGISPYKDRVPSLAGDSSVLTSQTEIQHITGEEIKQIRLKKKLSITQMAYLLNVSVRKYRDWELGYILVAPCIEEEILKIRDRKYRELHSTLQQVGVGAYPEPKPRRQVRIHPPPEPPIKTFSGAEIQEVCDILNLSQRELGNLLGIKKHNVDAWIRHGIHPKNPVIKKFMQLREKAMASPPEIRKKIPSRSCPQSCHYDYVKPEEITDILEQTHWTMRELGLYLGGVHYSLIWVWKKGRGRPSEEMSLKLRELQEKLKTGEIKPEYTGELVSVEEFSLLFRKLHWTANRLSKTLHITDKRIKGWLHGNGTPNYADTIKIRNLQKKILRGEVVPDIPSPKIPKEKIREICQKHRLTQYALAQKIGCSYSIIYQWMSGRREPNEIFNKRLLDLWNTEPEPLPPLVTARQIYECRVAMNLSQIKFGKLLGLSGGHISYLESGRKLPTQETSNKIKEYMKTVKKSS